MNSTRDDATPDDATPDDARTIAADEQTLHEMGYVQELARRMHGFSNFAMSLSIICILAGGVTSFHVGFGSVGGAAIGLGWPLSCAFSLVVAVAMAQVASAFPTAGGLYHWASVLGGKGWGWATAWFNLAGLVTVLAAINVGTFNFVAGSFWPSLADDPAAQILAVVLISASQAAINHRGIRLTTRLTDFSGYWILGVSSAMTIALLATASTLDFDRLWSFDNFSGLPAGNPVWPATDSMTWLFLLGLLLPAYTITGFDASAHTAEETIGAAYHVPRGIVRSVLVSGVFGWLMLIAILLAMPNLHDGAQQGDQVFFWTIRSALPPASASVLLGAIAVAQYLCGLATVTSASRMAFAFARDGGLPWSDAVRQVSPRFRTPAVAIWLVAVAAVVFTVYTPMYLTITAVCTIFLYLSYVLPTALGFFAYGRSWTRLGQWHVGRWYRPAAVVSVLGCGGLIVIGVQPPNEKGLYVVGSAVAIMLVWWWLYARSRFAGPPETVFTMSAEAARHD